MGIHLAGSDRRHLISATTKQSNERLSVDESLVQRLEKGQIRERTVSEKIELMVRWYADRSTAVGQSLPFSPDSDYPGAWCRSPGEWSALFTELVRELGYLKRDSNGVVVTVRGWQWLADKPKSTGSIAFIAMSFAEEFKSIYQAIHDGVALAGYDPVRMDDDHYTGGVMDRIIARIRESRFVVAEFGGNRGGVYYEAGFALGLGIPTIHLCSSEQLDAEKPEDRPHFDVRHLNFLPWRRNDLPTLTNQLRDRILAVFGKGQLGA